MGALRALVAFVTLLGPSAVIAIPTTSSSDNGYGSCTFTGSTGAASAVASKSSCSTITLNNVAVPAGMTLDLSNLNQGTTVIFEGQTTFGYLEWNGPLISISGSTITVTGAPGCVIDGDGSRWWDGTGSNSGKRKPKFFAINNFNSSSITGVTVKNTPVQAFSIDRSNDLTLSYITVDNSDGNSNGGHNTDGFDIAECTDLTITDVVVYNQDDCVAIDSGENILITNMYCCGGHGLSIGGVGGYKDNIVSNIKISNSQVVNSQNGVRIKATYGDTGSVSNIIYDNITLSGITDCGIVIRQDYSNSLGYTGTPTGGIPITNVTLSNIHGNVSSSATNIDIGCANCQDWTFNNVAVTGGKTSTDCLGVPSGISC